MKKMKEDIVIKCKNCNTKFKVNISDIGKNGRMVSCSVCEYEWLYIPNKSDPAKELIFPDKTEAQPPATTQKNSIFLILTISLLLVSTFLAIFLYIERSFLIKQHRKIETFYNVFDYYNTDGLELKIMKLKKLRHFEGQDNQKKQYEIPIKITNHTGEAKFLPVVRVIAYDTDCNKTINLLANIRRNIDPHSTLKINLKTEEITEGIDLIIVKIGNAHDLKSFDFDANLCHIKQ